MLSEGGSRARVDGAGVRGLQRAVELRLARALGQDLVLCGVDPPGIEAGRGLLYRACATANPFPDPTQAALAKIFCNEMAIRVTSEAIQIHGGYGFTDEYAVSRFFRGTRYGSLGGGTTETLRNLVGKKLIEEMDLATGVLGLGFF